MCLEMEAKVKVDYLAVTAERLATLGAAHRDDVTHMDTFYGAAPGGMIKAGCSLRLRRQTGENEKALLTYKGPRQKGRFKTRKEIETEVADAEAMDALLEAIGLHTELVLEKRRSNWVYKGCIVSLDEVPLLGSFVEVEGPSEGAIDEVLGELGLEKLEHVSQGYASLVRRRLRENGSGDRKVLFER